MPSMVTHRLFADDIYKDLNNGIIKQAIDDAFELFSIGSSGPDFFFFYGVWPWRNKEKKHNFHKFGSWIHREKVDITFSTLFTMCKETKNPLHIAYTSGILAHWCLDHTAHPYVFNQTGMNENLHRFYEATIDREIMNLKNITYKQLKPSDIVKYQSTTHEPIYDLYSAVIKNGWNVELNKEDVRQGVIDIYQVERFLYNPKGKRVPFVSFIEKLFHVEGYATNMMIPAIANPKWDVMNTQHRLWHHPQTNEEHTESFMDLYNRALDVAKEVYPRFEMYLNDELPLEDVLSIIGKKNFHTGLEIPEEFKYFDLVE